MDYCCVRGPHKNSNLTEPVGGPQSRMIIFKDNVCLSLMNCIVCVGMLSSLA